MWTAECNYEFSSVLPPALDEIGQEYLHTLSISVLVHELKAAEDSELLPLE